MRDWQNSGGLFDLAGIESEIRVIEEKMAAPDFWDKPDEAQGLVRRLASLKEEVERFNSLKTRAEELGVWCELGEETQDQALLAETEKNYQEFARDLRDYELRSLLSGEYDENNAILSLHAGAGGTEAQDWVSMLFRMFTRWAERKAFKVDVLDELPGEEAGLKSVTFLVNGRYAYGFLKAEKGVHRLVRISPFDASARRHTSFASLDVLPELPEEQEVEIDPADLKIDTFRSSGAGGQHVNKTDSAVRITHLPTGIVVSCQNERSQHANRLSAMKILQARLLQKRIEERQKELDALRGTQQEIAWGSQIRSYIFHPYTLVKDHRTGEEVGNIGAVMDGDIDQFIYAYLEKYSRNNGR